MANPATPPMLQFGDIPPPPPPPSTNVPFGPAVQPPADLVFTFTEDFGPLTQLKTFDMRDGDLANAKSLFIKPSIPQTWHWRPVENLAPENAVANVGAYIRSVRTSLTMNSPPGWSPQLINKAAIVVGTARAVTAELYRIEPPDLILGEAAPPHFIASEDQSGQTVISVNPKLEPNVQASLTTPLELTEADRAAITVAHMSAVGILPMQGYSIVMTGHHYLSDPKMQSRRAFDAMERQHWTSTAVAQWW
ncbi:uncharacterized protein LOC117908309 [Vitis riparia]|uniref:uncharacterized protein LOC117908309 n=1 Tax=Vitis riparia TaxID=96939 RepID=UPI00155ADE1F|nr:uncharacterized protein LOC117908309 [Vitis riparia]